MNNQIKLLIMLNILLNTSFAWSMNYQLDDLDRVPSFLLLPPSVADILPESSEEPQTLVSLYEQLPQQIEWVISKVYRASSRFSVEEKRLIQDEIDRLSQEEDSNCLGGNNEHDIWSHLFGLLLVRRGQTSVKITDDLMVDPAR